MNDNTEKSFGERLKRLRMERGMSRRALAEMLHVSLNTVTRYENNDVKHINSEIIESLAFLFGTTTNYLLRGFYDTSSELEEEPLIK